MTATLSDISSSYDYALPPKSIATHPCQPRDAARLLCLKDKQLRHHYFHELPELLPPRSSIFFNQSRVLPTRIPCYKKTGAQAEVFLLEGEETHLGNLLQTAPPVLTRALLRPSQRIPIGTQLTSTTPNGAHTLSITRQSQHQVRLFWHTKTDLFADMLERFGQVPLPPYIGRSVEPQDSLNYQCVYGKDAGSVAAPTAGLHFTAPLLGRLDLLHKLHYLSLHVGAGTFAPLKSERLRAHRMHTEHISIDASVFQSLRASNYTVAVGTTSLRSLESLYWYGCLLAQDPKATFDIPSFVHEQTPPLSLSDAWAQVAHHLSSTNKSALTGRTALYILPGYTFRSVRGLITNFHQPRSTLLVLLAALIGDTWRDVYAEALDKKYRFLSYGDASLFLL